MWQKSLLTLVVLINFMAPACTGLVSQKSVKVAISLPMQLEISQQMLNGAQLALKEVNNQVGNVTIELLIFDTSSERDILSAQLEQDAASRAITDEAVIAYITGAGTDQVRAVIPRLNEAGMAQISLVATWPGLTKAGFRAGEPDIYYPTGQRHFFRMVPSDDIQARAAAAWARQLGFKSVYIMGDPSTYGRGVATLFREAAADAGLQVAAFREGFDSQLATPETLTEVAGQIKSTEADLFYYGSSLGFSLIQAIRSVEPSLPVMVPDGVVQSELISSSAASLEGVWGTTVVVPVDQLPAAAAFSADYQAAYGQVPGLFAATGYEAMKVIIQAIGRTGETTRQNILTEIRNQGEFSGIMGRWHFEETGDISHIALSGVQIQNGQWKFVQMLQ